MYYLWQLLLSRVTSNLEYIFINIINKLYIYERLILEVHSKFTCAFVSFIWVESVEVYMERWIVHSTHSFALISSGGFNVFFRIIFTHFRVLQIIVGTIKGFLLPSFFFFLHDLPPLRHQFHGAQFTEHNITEHYHHGTSTGFGFVPRY
jgi:hypothetical protein